MNTRLLVRVWTGCLLLILCSVAVYADSPSDHARRVYEAALEKTYSSSHRTTKVTEEKGVKHTTVISRQVNPDGTVWTRTDSSSSSGVSNSILRNDSGVFFIYGNQVVKNSYEQNMQAEMAAEMEAAVQPESKLKLQTVSYRGTPCYLITETIEPTKEMTEAFRKAMGGSADMEEAMPVITEYYIHRENMFILGQKHYNARGKLLSENFFDKVEVNPQFEAGTFELPPNARISVAKTQSDVSTQSSKAIVKTFSRPEVKKESAFWKWLDVHSSAVARFGSWFFAVIGALCIGVVIVYKIRHK